MSVRFVVHETSVTDTDHRCNAVIGTAGYKIGPHTIGPGPYHDRVPIVREDRESDPITVSP